MRKKYITAKNLADILGVPKSTIYLIMNPEKKKKVAVKKAKKEGRPLGEKKFALFQEKHSKIEFKKENGYIKIDIDNFLENHKMFDFKFKNEYNNESFLDRMHIKEKPSLEDYPDYLQTSEIKELTGFSTYKLKRLREQNEIEYKVIEDKRYSPNAPGRMQYRYSKQSLQEYAKKHNIMLTPYKKDIPKYTKQFYTVKEVQDYIKRVYNKEISNLTVYRRINNTKQIPAIRIGTMIKIPILEFQELDLKSIFNIDKE